MFLKSEKLKLLPILIPFILFFLFAVVFAFLQSVGYLTPTKTIYTGFDSYRQLFQDRWFISSFLYSIKIAFLSAFLSISIGSSIAYNLWDTASINKKWVILYKIPLILPHIIAAFFVQIFFSNSGLISTLLFKLNIITSSAEFPNIISGEHGLGIIFAYIYKEVPFVILLQLAIYSKIDNNLIIAAKNLGGNKFDIFSKILIPILKPVINSTFIILFLFSLGSFEIPFLLGASRPEMIPIYIYKLYFEMGLDLRPVAMASLIILFIFSSLFVVLYTFFVRKISIVGRKL
ncbi:MAG: ABC transporter permease subunit [Spirochaetaceae bacterium]